MPDDTWNDPYDHSDPEPSWDEDESDTVACPACGAEIYEDSERCPVCGDYLTAQTSVWNGRPFWWIALGLLGIVAVTIGLVFGF
jgi:hypothetical protein